MTASRGKYGELISRGERNAIATMSKDSDLTGVHSFDQENQLANCREQIHGRWISGKFYPRSSWKNMRRLVAPPTLQNSLRHS
jgi:hypothetical protein